MFTDEQIAALEKGLPASLIKKRQQGSAKVSYIEGYEAINAANRIFGFGYWDGEIIGLDLIESTVFDNKEGRTGHRIGYKCVYAITVHGAGGEVRRSDAGFGSGTSYNSAGEAHESALKEAVTDAMKRTFRTFGDQFGLALYDKEQRNVDHGESAPKAQPARPVQRRTPEQQAEHDGLVSQMRDLWKAVKEFGRGAELPKIDRDQVAAMSVVELNSLIDKAQGLLK